MSEFTESRFYGGKNIAMKIPSHLYDRTVAFYKDDLGLTPVEEEEPNMVFLFGDVRLWLDREEHLSRAEIWLELRTDNLTEASEYLDSKGVIRRDEIEALPKGFEGFWIMSPANIIHLVRITEKE
jgi:hypothetical protein